VFEVSPLREWGSGPAQERHRKKEFGKWLTLKHDVRMILAKVGLDVQL
jgi:hypothetical protein